MNSCNNLQLQQSNGGKRLTITVMWQVLQVMSEKALTQTEEETCRRPEDSRVWLGAGGSGEGEGTNQGISRQRN